MSNAMKAPPTYAIASVDHALRIAAMLQLEGVLTLSQIAERLGVARSTAHRLLAMLVYRDFAVQGDDRAYRAGPVLELAAHSQSRASRLRQLALPHLERLVAMTGETANLMVRTGDSVRFIASLEGGQALRVGSREGMVFPAHRTSGGPLLLAALEDAELDALYAEERYEDRPTERPDLAALRAELAKARKAGFAVNQERSERGVIAVGAPVRTADGEVVAAVSLALPTVRYQKEQLPALVGILSATAGALGSDLERSS